ncbi:MAG: EthD domain-containing protein [Acidimicrobiia bacterium]|nr:EthD domain-containing protein [Acidimicrobiia bacterium]
MLELIGLGTDPDAVTDAARRLGATAYINHPGESDKRPYSAMLRVATDDVEAVREVSDVGLYVAFGRVVKAPSGDHPPERVIAAFGLVRHPDLTHRQADDHWRDVHGPLALVNHAAMCDYSQLSVVATLAGDPLDGLALCAFDSRQSLREKFFNDDDARAVIEADVATFADPANSPRRVVLEQAVG